MTIRGIRRLQNLCRGGLIVAVLMMPAPLLEDPAAARWMLLVMLAALVVSGVAAENGQNRTLRFCFIP